MMLRQDKGLAACGQGIAVAPFDGLGGFAARQAQLLTRNCQIRARGQAYKIQGVGSRPGFIEVVHAPNQAAFLVAPRTEVLDVEVADSQNGGGLCEVGADFGPKLNPAVKGSAKKRERRF